MKLNVTVIGTVFMDCKGSAASSYNPVGRNLGSIEFVHGGVARNVAENLAGLALPTTFISSVDKTGVGEEILQRLEAAGINTKYISSVESCGMGMWLVVLDEKGDLAGSISQMPRLDVLDEIITTKGERFIGEASHVVLELDLNESITKKALALAKENKKIVYGIPGNLDVIRKNIDILEGMDCFICNDIEAGRLMGLDFSKLDIDVVERKITRCAAETGLKAMVITLGSRGSVYYDAVSKTVGHQGVFPVNMVDSSGAGDAFFSGTVMGLIRELPLAESVVYGSKVAAWTIESRESNCRDLKARMQAEKIFEKLQG